MPLRKKHGNNRLYDVCDHTERNFIVKSDNKYAYSSSTLYPMGPNQSPLSLPYPEHHHLTITHILVSHFQKIKVAVWVLIFGHQCQCSFP